MNVLILIANITSMTVRDVAQHVEELRAEHPDMEIWLDGDRRAIVGRRHA